MGRGTPDTDDARRRRAIVLAEAALGRYGLREARLHLLRHEFKQVFRVELPTGEEFALRMYGTPRAARDELHSDDPRLRTTVKLRSPETLREQLTWLSALERETDLLVPEPVPLPDGPVVGHVSVEGVPERRHPAHSCAGCREGTKGNT